MATTFDSNTLNFGIRFDAKTVNVKSTYGLTDADQIKVWTSLSTNANDKLNFTEYEDLLQFLTEHNLNNRPGSNAVSLMPGDRVTFNTPFGVVSYTETKCSRIIDINDF